MKNLGLANLTTCTLFLLRATSGLTLPSQIVTPATDTSRVGHTWLSLTRESLDLFHFAELFTSLATMGDLGEIYRSSR
jgi:hypothetical protein